MAGGAENVSVPKANPNANAGSNMNNAGSGTNAGSTNAGNSGGINQGGANAGQAGQNAGNLNASGTQAGGSTNANMANVGVGKANVGSAGSNAVQAGGANAANAAGTTGSLGTNLTTGVGKLLASPLKAAGNFVQQAGQAITSAFTQGASGLTGLVGTAANSALVTTAAVGSAVAIGVGGVAVSTTDANPAIYDSILVQEDDCATYEASISGESGGVSIGSEEQRKNAYISYQTIYRWFLNNNYSNAENMAWGIVANIYRECSFNPALLEGGSTTIGSTDYDALANWHSGIGIVQWTNYKPHENPSDTWKSTKIANFFKENNMPWDTLESQLILLLSTNDPAHGNMIEYIEAAANLSTPEECNIMFLTKYEKPAQEYVNERTEEATQDINTVKVYAGQYALTANGNDDTTIETILSQAATLGDSAENLVTVQANNAAVCGNALGVYDNSSIANAAVSFAHPNKTIATNQKENESNPITALYHNVCRNTIGKEPFDSCDRASLAAVCWSGSDDAFATLGGVDAQYNYLSNSANEKWEYVGMIEFDDAGYPSNCQPGDILIATNEQLGAEHGHVIVYVGNEIIKAHFGDNADVPENANVVQASYGDYDAACGTITKSERNSKYRVFRCVNPDKSDTYKNAGEIQIN